MPHCATLEEQPEFEAERGKGGEAAEQPDPEEQSRRLAAAAAREPADEEPHREAAGDIDGEGPPRKTGAEPREHDLAEQVPAPGAERAAEHDGKKRVHR